jgi:hypothetical protein
MDTEKREVGWGFGKVRTADEADCTDGMGSGASGGWRNFGNHLHGFREELPRKGAMAEEKRRWVRRPLIFGNVDGILECPGYVEVREELRVFGRMRLAAALQVADWSFGLQRWVTDGGRPIGASARRGGADLRCFFMRLIRPSSSGDGSMGFQVPNLGECSKSKIITRRSQRIGCDANSGISLHG